MWENNVNCCQDGAHTSLANFSGELRLPLCFAVAVVLVAVVVSVAAVDVSFFFFKFVQARLFLAWINTAWMFVMADRVYGGGTI